MLGLCGTSLPAKAQIYSGVSETGSIVLSSTADNVAQAVLVEAERVDPVPPVAQVQFGNDFQMSVPANFMPFIKEASSTYRIPTELIHAVISVESNYNPNAVSPKGARGLMQLMPATAKRFGSNSATDPRQNILTGSRYLRWLLDFFEEDVELAIAAYNAGENAVVQAGHKIPRFTETQRYVPKVLSIYKKAKRMT
ncbi:MAG: lytic transglycosylase domain-containing protein [Rhodoferax sp.]|nr:lytic transglycosylase domain-containing protein [Rhodoferax sp.]